MHRPSFALICILAFMLPPLASAQSPADRDEAALASVIADYERLAKRVDPVSAGREGDREALRRWPDVRPQTAAQTHESLKAMRARLSDIDTTKLPADDALNHVLLVRLIDQQIEAFQFDLDRLPFQNDSGFHTLADYVARTTNATTREDAEAWMARLEALPAFYEQNIANARRGVLSGVNQPRIVIDRVLAVARHQAATEAAASSLLMPFDSLPEKLRAEYRPKAISIIEKGIVPMQRKFVEFLEQDGSSAARIALGIRRVPNGEEIYRFLVRSQTTTKLSPDEIHRIGLSEVARIRGLMEESIRTSGFQGTFADFLRMLRTDPRFYAQTPEDLMEKASEIAKRADDRLPALFGTLPRLPYGVRPVPAEIAEGYTTGRYWSGSMVLGQAGGYMVNTSQLDQRPLYELPALTLHEAVPGHHLQLALSQELTNVPYFRRTQDLTAFVEGWGLYAEFLGEEMGMYRDAYERFGRYSYEMWRACRLVADTGIHWLGWDIEQARRCFAENSALAPHNIQTELERYIAWPGQALAYKIGELRLRALREEAQQALGERFNVREFHDLILLGGSMPLDVLDGRVRKWIASKRGDQATN
jgi:uncharacterized protein (DUF885 family)